MIYLKTLPGQGSGNLFLFLLLFRYFIVLLQGWTSRTEFVFSNLQFFSCTKFVYKIGVEFVVT